MASWGKAGASVAAGLSFIPKTVCTSHTPRALPNSKRLEEVLFSRGQNHRALGDLPNSRVFKPLTTAPLVPKMPRWARA